MPGDWIEGLDGYSLKLAAYMVGGGVRKFMYYMPILYDTDHAFLW